ncbi:hypothetical protein E2C01_036700 [Portunus trituberculatus]|uniref:Uncharacterized protein n=1 Tax=Portunus trituberculatus TaxID=210409 RepID=A0A5B7FF12_PORTR|nr:hypothetical protein [Portunus trituberculatus]
MLLLLLDMVSDADRPQPFITSLRGGESVFLPHLVQGNILHHAPALPHSTLKYSAAPQHGGRRWHYRYSLLIVEGKNEGVKSTVARKKVTAHFDDSRSVRGRLLPPGVCPGRGGGGGATVTVATWHTLMAFLHTSTKQITCHGTWRDAILDCTDGLASPRHTGHPRPDTTALICPVILMTLRSTHYTAQPQRERTERGFTAVRRTGRAGTAPSH